MDAGRMVNSSRVLRTARLELTPVGGSDLEELRRIKADPRVFAIMLGGVRTSVQAAAELADDVVHWGARGFGMWAIRERGTSTFVGTTGLKTRPDERGVGLRFALWPEAQGRGLAREAAGAALRFGHYQAGLRRIVAVARASNFASRMVLGGIGMTVCESFLQQGWEMVMYESFVIRPALPADA
jgi:RimJ/RimL family protein N-acetyltransferase